MLASIKKQIVAENEKKVSKYVGSIDYPCMLNCLEVGHKSSSN